ncbi:MAG: hypothetical protein JO340_15455 [Acidobacteriaceae bacterium]|nr:hypothetical protein [Acidobacteriaceae bacterium]
MNPNVYLWTGVLGGPMIWLTSFEARFALAPWACTFQNKWALHAVAIAALILCAACAWLSFRQWRALGEPPSSPDAGVVPRSSFLAILGIVISCGCGLIVIAQAIPEIVLGACE